REALGYLFDFEWANKNLFYGAYARTESYFSNSDLASSGLPSPDELKVLEPLRPTFRRRSSPSRTRRQRPTAPATSAPIFAPRLACSKRRVGLSRAASWSTTRASN